VFSVLIKFFVLECSVRSRVGTTVSREFCIFNDNLLDVSFSTCQTACSVIAISQCFFVMLTITMLLMIIFWLFCRLHDGYYCVISSWCNRFRRSRRVVSIRQARLTFHVFYAKQKCMRQWWQWVSGSRVKWVNKSEWVTWVTGQYSWPVDPWSS